eukprot:scaffold86405_cov25-Prasinocladus_malaysianus.AAC.2
MSRTEETATQTTPNSNSNNTRQRYDQTQGRQRQRQRLPHQSLEAAKVAMSGPEGLAGAPVVPPDGPKGSDRLVHHVGRDHRKGRDCVPHPGRRLGFLREAEDGDGPWPGPV